MLPFDTVIIKCSEGLTGVDSMYIDNQKAIRNKRLKCGYYHFADGNDAKKEAQHFLKNIELQEGEFLCLDYEIKLKDPVTWCKTFLDFVYDNTGVKPLIYMNYATEKQFDWTNVKRHYQLWLADYGINNGTIHTVPVLRNWTYPLIHQYTSKGVVDGIRGNVDMNVYDNLDGIGKVKQAQNLPPEPPTIPDPNNVPPTPENPTSEPVANIPVVQQPSEDDISSNITPKWWETILSWLAIFLKK